MISTQRLHLPAVRPTAALDLAYGGGGGWWWLGDGPGEGTRAMAGAVARADEVGWHRPPWGLYAITRRDDGYAIGSIGFHGPPHADGTVEIGYDLVPEARGAGHATEAVHALTSFAFAHPAVRSVLALTTPDNTASQRVLARSGFTRAEEDPDGLRRYRVDR
ncbi:GNAT family N-acetyltransferase [Streptacidiphilus sp. EB103A]|uniref:GNAT family N-acetyltransferase n=1 Tax=Streptacidiphilus sp. EB103A TaxID=3156275 RepID=UPI00351951C6